MLELILVEFHVRVARVLARSLGNDSPYYGNELAWGILEVKLCLFTMYAEPQGNILFCLSVRQRDPAGAAEMPNESQILIVTSLVWHLQSFQNLVGFLFIRVVHEKIWMRPKIEFLQYILPRACSLRFRMLADLNANIHNCLPSEVVVLPASFQTIWL